MTTTPPPPQAFEKAEPDEVEGGTAPGVDTGRKSGRTSRRQLGTLAKQRLSNPWASGIAIVIALLWTVPTFGLLVTSFRPSGAIRDNGWWNALNPFDSETGFTFTLQNYSDAMTGSTNLADYFVNSLVITLPAVFIPISIALLAAYAFAWIDFRGRDVLFVAVFALQIVPIQITLIPLLTQYVDWGLAGSFWTVWLSHSIFALPLAIFLLHNFMKDIPPSLVEAARVDGAGHVKIFFQVLLPLLVPAIAAFAIFQFLWVWNDLLVALVFGSAQDVRPLTVHIAELAGTRGQTWHLLSAGAFISMVVPVIVFLSLQRYFVRGLLAGSVKG
ncbi:carbohydrate ABC transporter permease [Cellulomonas sp. APG4]|uniref:carbohydrate ABC transporter permease n=1 Tax=Cellulomonas sp. APG4 TaxID=1538656 RepID=UPI00137A968F|nr:carbohydrate ABC transporter permease [Cellulomonas sp. APG4]NCT91785.1 carbohydrate ABC transporter permease [Cellulomonas sp. APG4]